MSLSSSLQLEVASLISTPRIRSMANQIIQFKTTENVGESSTTGIVTHVHFCSPNDWSSAFPNRYTNVQA